MRSLISRRALLALAGAAVAVLPLSGTAASASATVASTAIANGGSIGTVQGGSVRGVGVSGGSVYAFGSAANSATVVNVVNTRQGKNTTGRFLAVVLGSVGKGVLKKAFVNSVSAIEARDSRAVHQ